jgi:hypothetical protein
MNRIGGGKTVAVIPFLRNLTGMRFQACFLLLDGGLHRMELPPFCVNAAFLRMFRGICPADEAVTVFKPAI